MRLGFVGAFESTYLPAHDVDVLETSGHVARRADDLALLRSCGISRLRYPVRWHRIEAQPGRYDWRDTDRAMGLLRDGGFEPIVDLVHHTSYPRWLEGGFADPRFGDAYLRYCEAFAQRYGWVAEYTLFNEPFATLFLCGHEAVWPPYGRGLSGLLPLYRNAMPAVAAAARMYADLLPHARHVWVDTCEAHAAAEPAAEEYAAMANDRRFFALDLLLGHDLDPSRPFLREVAELGFEDLFELEPAGVDVLGLDYYAHSEWSFRAGSPGTAHSARTGLMSGDPSGRPIEGEAPSPTARGLASLAVEYHDRYGLPMMLSETNVRGAPSDRATWLRYTLEQCEQAVAQGVPLEAYCWFPLIDSLDWNSLLARADRCIDPVGVFWLDEDLRRGESSMSAAFRQAVLGAPAADLPAYELTPDVAAWLAGLRPHMEHFPWQPPPAAEARHRDPAIVRARALLEEAAA